MTFNPGWNSQAEPIEDYDFVRKIPPQLKANGLERAPEIDEFIHSPGSCMVIDPDGDQHVGWQSTQHE
jgi:hypothetical protein